MTDTNEQDPVVDLPSIAAIRRHLFRRWVPHYAVSILKLVPAATLCGIGIHWLLGWLDPGASPVSALILPLAFGVCALLLCLSTLPAMLRLDAEIDRRLTDMEKRIVAGETVYASEVQSSRSKSP